ncbi:MAG: hypothetical protein GX117_08050 [Candidatus Hydrogenedentes bacterium]|nr:hypothetical protein [Candidatus Hydrogenedentota bacterium]
MKAFKEYYRPIGKACLLLCVAVLGSMGSALADGLTPTRIPVIYCTDLFHPHEDADDHFDLACIYSIEEFDLQIIILDQGLRQEACPGAIPVAQMNRLTGRSVPCVIGLAEPLTCPEDNGRSQDRRYQGGVEQILSLLEASVTPVIIFTVGSLRDVAAAYNRDPELLHNKISRLYTFIGNSQGQFHEYNVNLDRNAYRCIMNSTLPVYWVPCFDGEVWENEGAASYWQAGHDQLLASVTPTLLNFFLYMDLKMPVSEKFRFLYRPESVEKEAFLSQKRNLWCTAVFPHAAGRRYILRGKEYRALSSERIHDGDQEDSPFHFETVRLYVDDDAVEHVDTLQGRPIQRFRINDAKRYAPSMTAVTGGRLQDLSAQIEKNATAATP